MIRFAELENLGLSVAAMTERRDGDCLIPQGGTARADCCDALGISHESLTCGSQVHGTKVAVITEAERGSGGASPESALPAIDGLVTAVHGLPLAIFIADCVPLFLFAPTFRVGGLVHAGRKGTRADIAGIAVHTMKNSLGVPPEDIHALIGPSAGPGLYEVSEEIALDWQSAGLPCQGRNLDLWAANRLALVDAGVPDSQIHISGLCTIASGRFFSYRRGDAAARNMAVLML